MTLYTNSSGSWNNVIGLFAKTSSTWRTIVTQHIKDSGSWRLSYAIPRGIFVGGDTTTPSYEYPLEIEYITITTTGNSSLFGYLSSGRYHTAGCASISRGIIGSGYVQGATIVADGEIFYITIMTLGNSNSFGTLSPARAQIGSLSNSIRGIFAGGATMNPIGRFNNIDYITIATTGNSVVFGVFSQNGRLMHNGTCASNTRGIFYAGERYSSSWTMIGEIEYITIATTGNPSSFGSIISPSTTDLTGGCSNATRGVFAGGSDGTSSSKVNIIRYITIATTGNSNSFGTISYARNSFGASSSTIRGVFGGGNGYPANPATTILMEYVTISTTGNAVTFGNLIRYREANTGFSNSHGGLI
mgnify:CR=1 FL=1